MSAAAIIELERRDLEGLLADLYRRNLEDRSEAANIAAVLRLAAMQFDQLARVDQVYAAH